MTSRKSTVPIPKFFERELILCYSGPLLYEGKCLRLRYNPQKDVNEYWVHYVGWKKSYDEWIPETKILKYNDENILKQKDLQRNLGRDM